LNAFDSGTIVGAMASLIVVFIVELTTWLEKLDKREAQKLEAAKEVVQ